MPGTFKKPQKPLPDWDLVLSAASRLQTFIPDAVLVGGTASALHAGHRVSRDADHVVLNLKTRFDDILADLEAVAGWKTARVNRPVQILGSLDGIETGIRQLIREKPLETTVIKTNDLYITIPTKEEILRIKSFLIIIRNATRDYLDFSALYNSLGIAQSYSVLSNIDSYYPPKNGESCLQQLIVQLAHPSPFDLSETDLKIYKHLDPSWQDWRKIVKVCQDAACSLLDQAIAPPRLIP